VKKSNSALMTVFIVVLDYVIEENDGLCTLANKD
jgi:hypothetical protein